MIRQKCKEAVMLHSLVHEFLAYCRLANFSERSIQALTARLNELQAYLKTQSIGSVKKINYLYLVDFVAEFNTPSIHVRKSRVWTLRQFYHFLTLHHKVDKNIAKGLPYPKIEKTVPHFLTQHESSRGGQVQPAHTVFQHPGKRSLRAEKPCHYHAPGNPGPEDHHAAKYQNLRCRCLLWASLGPRKETPPAKHDLASADL